MPREVVEAEAAGTRYFGLACAEVDVHLKWREEEQRFIGPYLQSLHSSQRVMNEGHFPDVI